MAFWLLDRNAAPPARKAISQWFAGPNYDKEGVAAAIVSVFDRIYTSPLWGWRAALRSVSFSMAATVLVALQVFPPALAFLIHVQKARDLTLTQLLADILADYISLFFIRRWLIIGGKRPLTALATAPIIGLLICRSLL